MTPPPQVPALPSIRLTFFLPSTSPRSVLWSLQLEPTYIIGEFSRIGGCLQFVHLLCLRCALWVVLVLASPYAHAGRRADAFHGTPAGDVDVKARPYCHIFEPPCTHPSPRRWPVPTCWAYSCVSRSPSLLRAAGHRHPPQRAVPKPCDNNSLRFQPSPRRRDSPQSNLPIAQACASVAFQRKGFLANHLQETLLDQAQVQEAYTPFWGVLA